MKTILWLGSQDSYETVASAKNLAYNDSYAKPQEELPPLLNVQGNVGIISIKGSLVDGHAGYMRYYGVVGYEDIRDAAVAAVQHQGVQAILLDVKSGGGDVAGCHEMAMLLERVGGIKPIITYTGSQMASAALWIGCAGGKTYAAETAQVGSLGILSIHAERSKQLAEMGITVTVVRAGAEKALANSYEPLSEKGQKAIQDQANSLYDIFLGWVAKQKGMSMASADTKFGQGLVFIGNQAKQAGLVDEIGTFEDAYAAAQKAGAAANKGKAAGTAPSNRAATGNPVADNVQQVLTLASASSTEVVDNPPIPEGNPMKQPLNTTQLAALAAGVPLAEVTAMTGTPAALAEDKPEGAPADDEVKPTAAATDVVPPVDPTIALNAQIADLNTQLTALTGAAASANAAVAAMKADMDALVVIASNSGSNMAIALNDKFNATAGDATQVLAEHARLSGVFTAKFKTGGVAATNPSETEKPAVKAAVDPMFMYAVQSLSK